MHGTEEQSVTTENEIVRRLAKLEEAVLTHTKHSKDPLDRITPVVAILALAAIEGFALAKGADGAMFAPVVALIAALAGVKMGDTLRDIFGGRRRRISWVERTPANTAARLEHDEEDDQYA